MSSRIRTWAERRSNQAQAALVVLAVWVTGVYASTSVRRYNQGRSAIDTPILDQAIRSFSQFRPGTAQMLGDGVPIFGDHFHPIIVVLVPFYWVWSDARMLLIAQALATGLTVWLVGRIAIRRLGRKLGLGAAAAFSVGIGLQYGMVFDVHEVAFGMPLVAMAAGAFIEQRWRAAFWWTLSTLLIKEDCTFLVSGFAIAFWLSGRRRQAVWLAGIAGAWGLIVTKVVIPAFSPTGRYRFTPDKHHGPFSGDAIGSLTSSLSGELGLTILLMLAAVGFIAVRSPLIAAWIVPLAVRAMNPVRNHWLIGFHYNLLGSVVIFVAAISVLPRIKGIKREAVLITAGLIAVLMGLIGPVRAERGRTEIPHLADAHAAATLIPDNAYVGTHDTYTALLSGRTRVIRWSGLDSRDPFDRVIQPDWLLLSIYVTDMSRDDVIRFARKPGPYRLVTTVNGFAVLRRHR